MEGQRITVWKDGVRLGEVCGTHEYAVEMGVKAGVGNGWEIYVNGWRVW